MNRTIKVTVVCLLLCSITPLFAADISRIHYNNQDLFLSGANLAWRSFADDIGPNPSTPDIAHFTSVFSQFEANGGNVMRLWLHTNGANTPAWSGFTVTGPGTNTIADLQTILDLAWEHKVSVMCCLWSFDMLRESYGTTITDRSMAILTDPTYRQSYIDNSLIPMVTALAGHPAIVAWEIFNEPEGMSNEFGWSGIRRVSMARIQEFVNLCAGAIHRTDPTVMVTNGCWDMQAGTDVDGHYNYYTDARLIAAGGDTDGTLDFYCIHYYDWAGTAHSPFLHSASYWGLNKPLVIAEFYPNCNATYCTSTPYESLYQNGYAGALGWSWTDVSPSLLLEQMNAIWTAHPADVEIITTPDTTPPAAPTGLAAIAGNGTVSLNWNNNGEGDLDGYNVYRSTTSGSGYIKQNGSLLSSSNYIDNTVTNGITYYYVVTAVDIVSNEGNYSIEDSATPGVNIEILGSWVSGTSHTKENGTGRALIFVAHDEQNAAITLDSVTYGGQSMTKVIDRIVTSSNTYAYVAAYILNEAGVADATNNSFITTWSATPSAVGYSSVFLQNVNQTTLVGASDGNTTTTLDPIKTNPLATGDGDMVIVAATCGQPGTYTLGTGFTEGIDQAISSTMTGVTGHKAATGASETPSADFSATLNRQVIIGFVINAPEPPSYSDCGEVIAADHRLPSDLSGDCYVNYLDVNTIAYYWLNDDCDATNNYCGLADFEPRDGAVDFFDFSDFAMQWLVCNDPEDAECPHNW